MLCLANNYAGYSPVPRNYKILVFLIWNIKKNIYFLRYTVFQINFKHVRFLKMTTSSKYIRFVYKKGFNYIKIENRTATETQIQ